VATLLWRPEFTASESPLASADSSASTKHKGCLLKEFCSRITAPNVKESVSDCMRGDGRMPGLKCLLDIPV